MILFFHKLFFAESVIFIPEATAVLTAAILIVLAIFEFDISKIDILTSAFRADSRSAFQFCFRRFMLVIILFFKIFNQCVIIDGMGGHRKFPAAFPAAIPVIRTLMQFGSSVFQFCRLGNVNYTGSGNV